MSDPYVYRPPANPAPYNGPYQTSYVNTPRSSTPFIPDSAVFPSSPYSRPPSLNASPNRGAIPLPPDRYAFPGTESGYDSWYEAPPWGPPRERRPSWHGVNEAPWPGTVPLPTSAPAFAPGSAGSVFGGAFPQGQRRHSFSAPSFYPPSISDIQLAPLLNAEVPRREFFFDLSRRDSQPLLMHGRGQTYLVPTDILAQPASNPPIIRLRVMCDLLPSNWIMPVEVPQYNVSSGYDPPPLTVWDVLDQIRRSLFKPISHADFSQLPQGRVTEVTIAFNRRCKASRDGYDAERAGGVKRIDYLGTKTRFLGLLRAGGSDGWVDAKLVTEEPYI